MRPLADLMRPEKLEDIAGQEHLLGEKGILRRVIESGTVPNMVFYGPPGIGKTTVAAIIARVANRRLHILNGTNAGIGDIKEIIAELDTLMAPEGVILYLDEIQYFNKKQQQSLLEFVENGKITLIASTTENPYFYVYPAVLSRVTVFEFKPLDAGDIEKVVRRAFPFMESEKGTVYDVPDEVIVHISRSAGGDVRKALNAVEFLCLTAKREDGKSLITLEDALTVTQRSAIRYDRDGDSHYDIMSALQKSIRGSDPDAAVHYLARLLAGGDLPSACRRILVTAAEDIGLAYPTAVPFVKACVDSALQIGLPEAQIPLADAVILLATAPKSNSGVSAISAAMADIEKGNYGDIPPHLKDSHYSGAAKLGRGLTYMYPHGYPGSYVKQQYLPDELEGVTYYEYGDNKFEQQSKKYWEEIKKNPDEE